MHDLVIRGGTVVDGTGAAPFAADVAVQGDRIVAVGKIADRGVEEIDAKGLLVTPGFADIHTHYDAQASWSERLISSSINGVTTALIGNCGVGFAPCRPERREMLVKLMEGVNEELAREAMRLAAQKLPIKTKFVTRKEQEGGLI